MNERRLADGMWMHHEDFVLHLMDNGWSRADAEMCWRMSKPKEDDGERARAMADVSGTRGVG